MEQQDRLLNLRLLYEIDTSTYAQKATELRDKEPHLSLEIERLTRERYEIADIAVKAFELSQSLREKWFEADYAAQPRSLEMLCLNFSLDGVTLVTTIRKPFDMLAERPDLKNSRGERIRTSDLLTPSQTR